MTFQSIYIYLLNFWSVFLSYPYTLYILIPLIVILAVLSKKIKSRIFLPIINFFSVIAVLLFTGFIFNKGYDYISKYQAEHKQDQTTTQEQSDQSQEQSSPSQEQPEIYGIEPDIQNNDQYQDQTTKQLYYSVSCSSCYADGCPSNGYYYAGYDGGSYAYYYGLCQSCSCSSVVGHSFWK